MARVALFSATALALVATAFGHARLVVPAPWNPNPTKSAPCGGSTELAATATWVQGSTVTIQWQLIAPDGAGTRPNFLFIGRARVCYWFIFDPFVVVHVSRS